MGPRPLALLAHLEPGSPHFRAPACHLFIHYCHLSFTGSRPPVELPEITNSRQSSFSFKLHVAQILKTLKSGRVEKVYFRKLAPGGCHSHWNSRARKNIWHKAKKTETPHHTLKYDLVLISTLLGIKRHRTSEKHSVILLFSLVSKDNVHFPTLSLREDHCFF